MNTSHWIIGAILIAGSAAAADPHKGHPARTSLAFATFGGQRETARFSTPDAAAPLRSYTQSSSMQLRDPGPHHVSYQESADLPTVRSGNLAFDALFALAGAEMKQDSVREIRDGSYNGGAAIPCDCFETGEKWHYVWTRDLSYAADLGLALLDPQRVKNSLDFKLSAFRAGVAKAPQVAGSADGLQIIQDTGSGGSWPVSTDRVSWAFGAEEVLKTLGEAERRAFAPRALKALANTIENDRLAAFDSGSGLYTGEQSFLDWREQSYAAWIVDDLSSMATSKALSTNVAHYKALTLAAALAQEQGEAGLATKYAAWADQLKQAINDRLWLADAGMYSSLSAAHFDGAPLYKFDWLGQALAIVTGVADAGRARKILAHYPHGPMGAPVIYPQQQGAPVYHNRAIWPFVTAYGLKAAAMSGNVSVADAAYRTLMRGAALNLSNMENLEWLSGQPLLRDEKDPSLTGPVINSKRQLWSVGAYLGMVIENVFGIGTTADGIAVHPFITARLRRESFGQAQAITLNRLHLRGKQISVKVHLPPVSQHDGYYPVAMVTLNGASAGQAIGWDQLQAVNVIEIRLGALRKGDQLIRRVSAGPHEESSKVYGPREPAIASLSYDGARSAQLDIAGADKGAVHNVYRDGKLVAARLAEGVWTDRAASAGTCYAVEAQFADSGNRSHHSVPKCVDAGIVQAADHFPVEGIQVPAAGNYMVQVRYHNSANQINLGISGGVKWLAIRDAAGRTVAEGVVQLPHARSDNGNKRPVYSTPLRARLDQGRYRVDMSDFYNMSYLQSNSTFSAAGGAGGPSNTFDIHGVRFLRVN